MRSLVICRLVFLISVINITALAQEIELWPTKILVNIGPDLFSVDLNEKLAGSTKRHDALGDTKIDVELNYEKKIVLLSIPERKITYKGKFSLQWVGVATAENTMTRITCTAIVDKWDSWSQDASLERLKAEIDWRSLNIFNLLVDETELRVYVTPRALTLIQKFGGTLSPEEFKLPSSNYVHSFKNSKGAIIFDSENTKLFMRLIDVKGNDTTFQIKKNGEIKPVSPKNDPTKIINFENKNIAEGGIL